MKHPRTRHWRTLLALFAALTLVAAACGDDDGETSDPADDTTTTAPEETSTTVPDGTATTATTAPSDDPLATPNEATGEPVRIGYSYDGATDAADNTEDLIGAKAAVEYINTYLGGIGGRPIELEVCATNLDPAKATACVTQFASADVIAVVAANPGLAGVEIPPLAEQGIPVMLNSTQETVLLSNPNVFIINSGKLLSMVTPAKLAADAGATNAALLVIDIPAAAEPLKAGAPGYYEAAGVDLDVITIPPDAPDFSPQVQAAMTKDIGQFFIVGSSGFCSRAINAIEASGFDGQILALQFCFDDESRKTITNLEGIQVVAGTSFDHDDAEYQLFTAVMEKFASKDVQVDGGPAVNGYSAMLALARATSGLKGEVTRDTVRTAITTMTAQLKPVGGGLEFRCNGPDKSQTSVCSSGGLVATLDKEGQYTDWEAVDGSAILKDS
jgi:branched-chain amino acid transport system substrate-binding protein